MVHCVRPNLGRFGVAWRAPGLRQIICKKLLGYVDAGVIANLDRSVLSKQLADQGMPDFTGKLRPEDLEKIKAFILGTADAIRPK